MSIELKKIAVSAGELSGDQHSSKLVKELKKEHPNIQFLGMGGKNLKTEGVRIIVNSEKYGSLNGFNIPKIIFYSLYAFIKMSFMLYKEKPDALILTDYPDFNLRLARIAKLFKIKTYYFIPPKVWAWRSKRVELFKKYIDQTITIFPFEKEFFEKNNYNNVTFAGHPFTTDFAENLAQDKSNISFKNRDAFLRSLGLVPTFPTIAVLPGSRKSEIKRHLPLIIDSLRLLKTIIPDIQAVIPIAPNINNKLIKKHIKPLSPWTVTCERNSRELMRYVDAGILKSGTCNLEACFLNLPFVCIYKTSTFNAWLVKKYVLLKEFSLVNIIKTGSIKELMQENATPKNIAEETKKLIYNADYRKQIIDNYKSIQIELSAKQESSAYKTAANVVLSLTNKHIVTKKTKQSTFKRLTKEYLKPYVKLFIIAMFAMICFGATDGALPFIVKHFLDGVFSSQNKTMLYTLPLLLVAIAVFRAISGFFQEFLMAKIGHSIVRDIRNKLHSHILKFTPGYFNQNSSGNILSRFTSDVVLVKDFLTQSLSAIIRDTIRIIVLIIAAFYLDPLLASIALIAFPLGVFPIYYFGKKIRKLSKKGQDEIGSISSLIHETVQGNRVIKLFNQEKKEQTKFEISNEILTKTFIKSEKNKAITNPINEILAALAICGVILYGGFSVIGGDRTQGDFIAFLVAVFLTYDPFKKLSKVYNQMQQGASGAERIFEILDEESPIIEVENPTEFPKNINIEFKNINFRYNENTSYVLKDINLNIKQGQRIAIVGLSGSGKSTLVDLIPRFIDPTEGEVVIGGINIKDLKIDSLRQNIAMVNQHTFLFNDTIYNNIAYGRNNASIEEVENAAKAAYAYDFIMSLPNKFDTNVGESGFTLSGGERQRIAIARAILKDAPLLILDEATASLDNQSENEVQKALEKLQVGRTSIIIAHRLSTIRSADIIVVMSEGIIVEIGKHQDLINNSNVYSTLHSLQFREASV